MLAVSLDLHLLEIDGNGEQFCDPFRVGLRWYYRLTPTLAAYLWSRMHELRKRFEAGGISKADWEFTQAAYMAVKEAVAKHLDPLAVAEAKRRRPYQLPEKIEIPDNVDDLPNYNVNLIEEAAAAFREWNAEYGSGRLEEIEPAKKNTLAKRRRDRTELSMF